VIERCSTRPIRQLVGHAYFHSAPPTTIDWAANAVKLLVIQLLSKFGQLG
jgi:hypothetical protein